MMDMGLRARFCTVQLKCYGRALERNNTGEMREESRKPQESQGWRRRQK